MSTQNLPEFKLLKALCLSLLLSSSIVSAQNVGINNTNPHTKSLLDLTSSDKGLLAPRMTELQRDAMFPVPDPTAAGMLVYQTDNIPGFYFYNGGTWLPVANENTDWVLNGNSGINPASNFLGTNDLKPLPLRTNGIERLRITEQGHVGIGTAVPAAAFQVSSNSSTGFQNIKIRETGNDYARIGMYNDSTTKFWEIATYPNTVDSIARLNIYNSSTGDLLSVFGNGRVGIGQTAPAAQLSLSNALGNKLTVYGTHGNLYGFGIQTSLFQIFSGHVNADIVFGYGNSLSFVETMRVKGTGNVGIGTTNPLQRLHVAGNINIPLDSSYRINNIPIISAKGSNNFFAGQFTGLNNSTGVGNTFVGYQSGTQNTIGTSNVFLGWFSGLNNVGGNSNTFIGKEAGKQNQNGVSNTFVGMGSGLFNDGNNNVYIGLQCGFQGVNASHNTYIGNAAGNTNISGNNNVAIGSFATTGTGNTNAIAIGSNANVSISNAMVLGGIGASAVNVGIGVSAPSSTLEVNGYSKLGSDAPAIKVIKYGGVTSSSPGGYTEIPFGVNPMKILSVQVLLEYAANQYLPPSFRGFAGYEFDYFTVNNRIGIQLSATNSASAINLPVKVLITYEQ